MRAAGVVQAHSRFPLAHLLPGWARGRRAFGDLHPLDRVLPVVPVGHLLGRQLEGDLGHFALEQLVFECDEGAGLQGQQDAFGAAGVEVANLAGGAASERQAGKRETPGEGTRGGLPRSRLGSGLRVQPSLSCISARLL